MLDKFALFIFAKIFVFKTEILSSVRFWWFGGGVRRERAQRRKAGALVRGGVAQNPSTDLCVTYPILVLDLSRIFEIIVCFVLVL